MVVATSRWIPVRKEVDNMLKTIDRIEEKYFSADATVAPGGWCCNCNCTAIIDLPLDVY
ncbi:hypothetical protein Prum_082810 [Phytohabitans rumicis]|uniref:Uncharacterized protein n=1 Tax=Phytohabitans rumicis TaxID=1076125 RepID=A0A6V8LJ20_9ACTN|nr:hypothetical protein Prum_082810 [Phytohabitans rumicis]